MENEESPKQDGIHEQPDSAQDSSEGHTSSAQHDTSDPSSSLSHDYSSIPSTTSDPADRTTDPQTTSGSESFPSLTYDLSPGASIPEEYAELRHSLQSEEGSHRLNVPDFSKNATLSREATIPKRRKSDVELMNEKRIKRTSFAVNSALGPRGHSNIVELSCALTEDQLADQMVLLGKITTTERNMLLDRDLIHESK